MTLDEYFTFRDSPSKNSPIGRIMQTIVADEPGIDWKYCLPSDYEAVRKKAGECLLKAASRKTYRVMSPKQDAASKASIAKRMGRG